MILFDDNARMVSLFLIYLSIFGNSLSEYRFLSHCVYVCIFIYNIFSSLLMSYVTFEGDLQGYRHLFNVNLMYLF